MSAVQELLSLNEELYETISKPSPKSERDQVISKIKEFLARREGLLSKLTGPYSAEDQLLGQQILDYDRKIQAKFNELTQAIKADFFTVKNQKRNTAKYINPYQSTIVNGVFYDKRK